MIILDGKALFKKIKIDLSLEVKKLIKLNKKVPHLSAILVGDNPASQTYINAKVNACNEVGFKSSVFQYPDDVSENTLLKKRTRIQVS